MKQISSKELVNSNNSIILDIRDSQKFNDWKIKNSQNIDVYNDIWEGNFDIVKQKLSKLPKDKTIITVCNMGITSQKASDILNSLGYKTLVLEKGMLGWNSFHKIVNIVKETNLEIKQIIRPGKGCLSYLIISNKEALIIDPSNFVNEYLDLVKKLKVKGVIDTHVHADHISGSKKLAELTKSDYYVSSQDFKANTQFNDLKDIQEITLGKIKIKIIKTPGHTDGSLCFNINEKFLLTGDTLFLESVGRPDLGRNIQEIELAAKNLFFSLNKIKELNKDIIILPCHFSNSEQTQISEKLSKILEINKQMQINNEKEFVKNLLTNLPNTPPNYHQIKNINMNNIKIDSQFSEQLEFGPNRCSSH